MSWLHRVLGRDGVTQLGIEANAKAARITGRPLEIGTRGSYVISALSGTMAAGIAANAEIYQARWVDATRLCLLRSVIFTAARDITGFTAGRASFECRVARAWTVDGTGGTALLFSTANSAKRKTAFAQSLFSDTGTRIASTAALTAGTKTLDANAFANATVLVSSAATTTPDAWMIPPGSVLWQRNTSDEWPIVFAQNEGFVIRAVTIPATGTWAFSVAVEWAEIDPAAIDGW